MTSGLAHSPCRPSFGADRRGNVAMIFGLTLIPIMLTVGAAVDYTRYVTTRAALQEATDSATLAVASKMTSSTTVAQATSQTLNILQTRREFANAIVTNVTISADRQTFCASSQVTIPAVIMKIANIETVTPTASSCANLAGAADPNTTYEIALVLDNSGSMMEGTSGTTKIKALQTAANNFISTMFKKSKNVKFSITPFAANVVAVDPSNNGNRNASWVDNSGANSQHWVAFGGQAAAKAAGFNSRFDIFSKLKAVDASWDWGGCFEPQTYPNNVNDKAPTPNDPELSFVPYLAPDEPSSGRYSNNYLSDSSTSTCPAATTAWGQLTNVCKYASPTAASSGYGGWSYYGSGPNNLCPDASTQTLMQLNGAQATVTAKIKQLVAGGNTDLHEGFMWGWRTLSPNLPFAGGRSYNAPKNRKVLVLMTDGYNNWQSQPGSATGSIYQALGYYSYNGKANARFPDGTAGNRVNYQSSLQAAANSSTDYHDTSRQMQDELTLEACANAKAAGIEVFTIGFSVPSDPIDSEGLALLQSCATNKSHYFYATDASGINMAFSQIGTGLGSLRLTQ